MRIPEGALRKHVRESNLIEGIIARPGSPFYDDHLFAARTAAKGGIVRPNYLHEILARRLPGMKTYAGKYRTCGVRVGDILMPRPENVPVLMEEWLSLVKQYESAKIGEETLEEAAHFLHVWFVCIHPYRDGNGRTARLVWNMLRVNKGLPWHVEPAKTKHLYYARIRRIEEGVFKKSYPNAY